MFRILLTSDGSQTLYSEEYGVTFHSRYGAITESMHVFIRNGLWLKWAGRDSLRILEMGFGSGLNAFLTWLEVRPKGIRVAYTAIEAHPLPEDIYTHLDYPDILQVPEEGVHFLAMHRDNPAVLPQGFRLNKILAPLQTLHFEPSFDLVFYDAFAPNSQMELWEEPQLAKMVDALLPGGLFVTYCAKGVVKRTLKNLGMRVECIPGPPGKREMTLAWKG